MIDNWIKNLPELELEYFIVFKCLLDKYNLVLINKNIQIIQNIFDRFKFRFRIFLHYILADI